MNHELRRPAFRRRALLTGLATPALASTASGQDGRPLQIVVGYAPGGGSDVLARLLGEAVTRKTGRAVVVRNLPGAGGQIAAANLLREGNDGSQLLAINHPDLFLAVARPNSGMRAEDFQIILVDIQDPRVMLVKKGAEIDSFAAFVSRARAQPGSLAVSAAAGGAQELLAKWLFEKLAIDVTIAGYRGGSEAGNALLSGDVAANVGDDFSRYNLRDVTQALFVGGRNQSPRWPEAPTLAAALQPFGVVLPSPDFLSRFGIYAVPARFKAADPAGYRRLQQMLLDARDTAEFRAYLERTKLLDLSIGRPGEEYEAAFRADMAGIPAAG